MISHQADRRTRDTRPTQRAVGVELEPGIDAVDMEGMRAVRKQLEPFLLPELIQADCTVVEGRLPLGVAVARSREFDDGNGTDYRRIKTVELGGYGVDDGRYIEVAMAAGLGRGEEAAEEVRARPAEAALDDEDVVADEEHGGGQNAQDGDGQDRKAGDGSGGVWRWRWFNTRRIHWR